MIKTTLLEKSVLFLILLIALSVGAYYVSDYGASWDEAGYRDYARLSIGNYKRWISGENILLASPEDTNYYGPAFVVGVGLVEQVFESLPVTFAAIDVWHFSYFMIFLVSVVALYFLARRGLGNWASFGCVLLFLTQPLLWGHAFINPKDIPFMAFFLLSVTIGLYAADSNLDITGSKIDRQDLQAFYHRLKQEAISLSPKIRCLLMSMVLVTGSLVLFAFFGYGYTELVFGSVIRHIYTLPVDSFLKRMFLFFAQDSGNVSAEIYIYKALNLFNYGQWVMLFLFFTATIVIATFSLPQLRQSIRGFLRSFTRYLLKPSLLLAGTVLGLTTSIRILGPLAGILVAFYVFSRSIKKSISYIAAYGLVAIVVTYITWPFLWDSPFKNLVQALTSMSDYPWTDPVLFNGVNYSPKNLPWYYLPELISIQLTEPVVILFFLSIALFILRKAKYRPIEIVMLFVWMIVPLAMPAVLNSRLYDNFRHFLFVLPPLFIIAGVSIDFLMSKISLSILRVGLLLLLILPGIYNGVLLHPYEYVYYNALVGQVGEKMNGRFELDYWATSYRESALFLNEVAPKGARIIVFGPAQIFSEYARPDLTVMTSSAAKTQGGNFDYLVTVTRWNNHLKSCPDSKIIYSAQNNGAVYSVVKRISAEDARCP